MQSLSTISSVLVLLITPVVLALAARSESIPVHRGADGWFTLRPSLALVVLGVLCIPMASFSVLLLLAGTPDKLFSGALMGALSAGGLYIAFAMHTRFNDAGVEYGGLVKTVFAPWHEIARFKYHPFWGPQIKTKQSAFMLPRFYKGFRQLMDEATRRGIEIPRAFQR